MLMVSAERVRRQRRQRGRVVGFCYSGHRLLQNRFCEFAVEGEGNSESLRFGVSPSARAAAAVGEGGERRKGLSLARTWGGRVDSEWVLSCSKVEREETR
jgi:hypothetical protein